MTPSGREMKLDTVNKRGSLPTPPCTTYSYTPFELGEYLLYGMRQSPFPILCTPPPEPGRVRVYGDALDGGFTCAPAQFTIDTREAGHGPLGISIIGQEEVLIHCLDNYDGTCLCSFFPTCSGDYTIHVTFDERAVPSSPFLCIIRPKLNPPASIVSRPHGFPICDGTACVLSASFEWFILWRDLHASLLISS